LAALVTFSFHLAHILFPNRKTDRELWTKAIRIVLRAKMRLPRDTKCSREMRREIKCFGRGQQERHLIRNTFTPRNVAKFRPPAFCRHFVVSFIRALIARNEGHDLLITRKRLHVCLRSAASSKITFFFSVRRFRGACVFGNFSRRFSRSSEKARL